MQQCDVIVVGAGPAGCAAAYDLASSGRRVFLLDRSEFPRHKACAGGLTRKTLRALRYSVAPVTRQIVSSVQIEKCPGEQASLASRNPVCVMTVRRELDDFCLKQTLAAGARFLHIGPIDRMDLADGEVVLNAGDRVFRSRFLIGADGVHSQVRRLLFGDSAVWFRRGFALEAELRGVGSSPLAFDLAGVPQGYGWVFPKRDHLNIGLYTESTAEKIDRERLVRWAQLRFHQPKLDHITGQFLGFGAENAPASHRKIFLVGDAGGFADPLTGEGIYGAVASGQAAAAAIEADLSRRAPADLAFAEATAILRRDLRLSASGARWFYGNLDNGFRALTAPLLRSAAINAYANGTKIAALANAVRRFAGVFASGS